MAAIIGAHPDMVVVGQAGNGEEALRLFEAHAPDITLMDLRLPDVGGAEAIRAIRARNPRSRCIVLTTYEGDEDIYQALQAGARGYLVKGMSHDVLVSAIRKVHAGERFVPPAVAHKLAERRPDASLSPRESEVLRLIVQGRSNREIAASLGITEATVKCHVTTILGRLGVADRTQAAVSALQRGIVHF